MDVSDWKTDIKFGMPRNTWAPLLPISEFCQFFTEKFASLLNWNWPRTRVQFWLKIFFSKKFLKWKFWNILNKIIFLNFFKLFVLRFRWDLFWDWGDAKFLQSYEQNINTDKEILKFLKLLPTLTKLSKLSAEYNSCTWDTEEIANNAQNIVNFNDKQ